MSKILLAEKSIILHTHIYTDLIFWVCMTFRNPSVITQKTLYYKYFQFCEKLLAFRPKTPIYNEVSAHLLMTASKHYKPDRPLILKRMSFLLERHVAPTYSNEDPACTTALP